MSSASFDTIVIGSGTSAYFAITHLNKAGQKVAVVDERDYGGTCALRGCQPKKYLVANAEAVAMSAHLHGKGLSEPPQTNWQALQGLKNEFLDGLSEGEVDEFKKAGIATHSGHATLTAPNQVSVGDQTLTAKNIVLATGATPRITEIPGSEHVQDSEHFLNLPTLPKRILFIGGGYISFEFAHVAARAGANVTILHRSAQPLKVFDPDMVKLVCDATQAANIKLVTNEPPSSIKQTQEGFTVHARSGTQYECDLIIEATGRLPNLSSLAGDHGNVQSSNRGVTVNQHLQSVSNPAVYAIGDCAATPYLLAPVADEEGKVAAHNILHNNTRTVDYEGVPSAVFTIPNLAAVGLTESQATEKGLEFRVNQGTTTGWPSSKRIGETHAGYKILIETGTNRILGAHIVRHNASEVINTFALAIKHNITAPQLAEFIWAYPTYTSDLKYMVR